MENKNSKRRKRVLLVSCAIILLCMSIIVGVSYSLFSDRVLVHNHLEAGNLDIKLERIKLDYAVLTTDGFITEATDGNRCDFTNASEKNVFGFDVTNARIAPGCYFDATMEITNNGNVAFDYFVTIEYKGGTLALAKQIDVTITLSDGTVKTVRLDQLLNGLTISAGQMSNSDKAETFGVKVEFLDDVADGNNLLAGDNNTAKSGTIEFDLTVSAVQASR